MVYTLLTWPPGDPATRFNLLRRVRYCGGVTNCVHDDFACCCKGGRICGCSNWQGDCAINLLPDLTVSYTAPTCLGSGAPQELNGLSYTLHWCECFRDDGPACNTDCPYIGTSGGWFGMVGPTPNPFGCAFGMQCTALLCIINTDFQNAGCHDYQLRPNFELSGSHSTSPDVSYPTTCDCGDAGNNLSLSYEGVFQLEEAFPSSSSCCDGGTYPIPFDAFISGPPRALLSMMTAADDRRTELRHPGRTFSTPPRAQPPRAQRKPVEEEDEETGLPEDVEDWLNGDEAKEDEDKEGEK